MTDWQILNEIAAKGLELHAAIRRKQTLEKYGYPRVELAAQDELILLLSTQQKMIIDRHLPQDKNSIPAKP